MYTMLDVLDNKIANTKEIYDEVISMPYYYGEKDQPEKEPTGLISYLHEKSITYRSIKKFIKNEKSLKKFYIYRAYVNIFSPREICSFHQDDYQHLKSKTLLYYANLDWNIENGGETKFVSENNTLISVLPVPGRIIIFDADMKHSASSFTNKHRFTVAFKLKNEDYRR